MLELTCRWSFYEENPSEVRRRRGSSPPSDLLSLPGIQPSTCPHTGPDPRPAGPPGCAGGQGHVTPIRANKNHHVHPYPALNQLSSMVVEESWSGLELMASFSQAAEDIIKKHHYSYMSSFCSPWETKRNDEQSKMHQARFVEGSLLSHFFRSNMFLHYLLHKFYVKNIL